jgi:hypothetical protein
MGEKNEGANDNNQFQGQNHDTEFINDFAVTNHVPVQKPEVVEVKDNSLFIANYYF